jgi:VWFA-related protein
MSIRTSTLRGLQWLASCAAIAGAVLIGLLLRSPVARSQQSEAPEVATQESQPAFKIQTQRNLVVIRAVVRDAKGRAVGILRKEDFRVTDNGKPQEITHFSVETPIVPPPVEAKPVVPESPPEAGEPPKALPEARPLRFFLLFFDDLNTTFGDLARGRDAADRFLASTQAATDHIGIVTASGLNAVEFTEDRARLREGLLKLRANPRTDPRTECPELSDYQADRIVHLEDREALGVAVDEAIHRCNVDPHFAEQFARTQAQKMLDQYEFQAHLVLQNLENAVRRLAGAPGQRNLILVSAGFLPLGLRFIAGEAVDRALRSNVVISSLDPKGLAVLLREADASREYMPGGQLSGMIHALDSARESAASEIMVQLAQETGGEFFHNSNDLDAGFRQVFATPEVYYILAFSPQNLKYDGRFHNLKVSLTADKDVTIQARRGYFAPKQLVDADQQAKEEIETAAFSRDELGELPAEIHTRFFRTANNEARLSVLAHVDMSSVPFRKEEDRNSNKLIFVTVLFDRDGNYVAGTEKTLKLRLHDATLEKIEAQGITVKTDFTITPGTYLVREVIRESEGGRLSGLNTTVEIPY